jgi:hypothetical protein
MKIESQVCRDEKRYIVGAENSGQLVTHLLNNGYAPLEYVRQVVQTLYFTTAKFKKPSSGYLRARRYKLFPSIGTIALDDDTEWNLEQKDTDGQKQRISLPYRVIRELLADPRRRELTSASFTPFRRLVTEPVGIVAATEWVRTHFVNPTDSGLRITLDSSKRYYGFMWGQSEGELMGVVDELFVEIKQETSQNGIDVRKLLGDVSYTVIDDNWHEAQMREMYRKYILRSIR